MGEEVTVDTVKPAVTASARVAVESVELLGIDADNEKLVVDVVKLGAAA